MEGDELVGLVGEPAGGGLGAAAWVVVFSAAAFVVLEDFEGAGVGEEFAEEADDLRVGGYVRFVMLAV